MEQSVAAMNAEITERMEQQSILSKDYHEAERSRVEESTKRKKEKQAAQEERQKLEKSIDDLLLLVQKQTEDLDYYWRVMQFSIANNPNGDKENQNIPKSAQQTTGTGDSYNWQHAND